MFRVPVSRKASKSSGCGRISVIFLMSSVPGAVNLLHVALGRRAHTRLHLHILATSSPFLGQKSCSHRSAEFGQSEQWEASEICSLNVSSAGNNPVTAVSLCTATQQAADDSLCKFKTVLLLLPQHNCLYNYVLFKATNRFMTPSSFGLRLQTFSWLVFTELVCYRSASWYNQPACTRRPPLRVGH